MFCSIPNIVLKNYLPENRKWENPTFTSQKIVREKPIMKKIYRLISLITILLLTCGISFTQTNTKPKTQSRTSQQVVTPAASSATVTGSGTVGRIAKWTGVDGANSFSIGNTNLFEDKFGKVGIGTIMPTSPLTVQGMVETTLGGYKFPDGTIQTTAAVTGLQSVFHDTTLVGNGTSSSPLGVAIPLILSGSVDNGNGVITPTNTAPGGAAIFATGGDANATTGGGSGVLALGGTGGTVPGSTTPGGSGVVAFGGSSTSGNGGTGGSLVGGVATAGNGGDGLFAIGALGVGTGKKGGRGLIAIPGGGAGGATAGLAGEFLGDVEISGNLAKGGGSFKIDHPLDPENKYLYHSFVESPDMMNIYNGNITTDTNGEAVVEMPDYFESLNRDFRYQLTVIGTFAQAIVAEKIKGNQFRIKTNAPNIEVSWQVTGVRQDAYANKHRIPVEQPKTATERGYYLHPDAFNQPRERGVSFKQNSKIMQQISEQSEQLKQKAQQEQK